MTMIYKKRALIVFFALVFVFAANAMPPHPKNTNPKGRERTENITRMEEPLYKSMMRSSPARAPALPREMNLLVILADFGSEIDEQLEAGVPLNFKNKNNYIIPSLLLIFLIIQILFKNRKRYILLNAYLLLILSCTESASITITTPGDPLHFKTPDIVNVFKNILGANDAKNPISLTMKKYWEDMSRGNLILNFDIVGPVRVSKGWQYYGRNRQGFDSFPGQFVGEAVRLAYSEGYVTDFSKYANLKPGIVDTVIIVHAGQGEEIPGVSKDAIWSHSWTLNAARSNGDGNGAISLGEALINRYTIQPEYNFTPGDAAIGVFCHEFAHVLGLPDLYDTSYETHGVGRWSLMSAGSWGSSGGLGEDPAPLLAWERDYIGGDDWVIIKPVTTTSITIEDIEANSKTAYKIPLSPDESQYFLLERKTSASGEGKKYVPADGILITHINKKIIAEYIGPNTINEGRNRVHGINIVEALGTGAGGKGALWEANDKYSPTPNHANMVFLKDDQINRPTVGVDDNFPNSNYYINYLPPDNEVNKTGYSGKKITVTSESSVSIE
ncbi:MAG: M6 family metalloprotease domain-containing protein [Spirochaetaceae bacterium]|nr:M6 family metalloprotease domain-containing protein [Spirochaetaceae bacterium]